MVAGLKLESGFAEVDAGAWLVARAQPAACFGDAVRRRRPGWWLRDRARLDLVETTAAAKCAEAARPFLTHIPCAAPISAVSDKILVAPAAARTGDRILRPIPFSVKGALCITTFAQSEPAGSETAPPPGHPATPPAWVVMATASRTARVSVPEGETFSLRPESLVAWSGPLPSGFCPRIGFLDVLLPRAPRNLLLRFHGPSLVWLEGAGKRAEATPHPFARRAV